MRRLAAALRALLGRPPRRPAPPASPARDNPYARYFTADPTPAQIARRLRQAPPPPACHPEGAEGDPREP